MILFSHNNLYSVPYCKEPFLKFYHYVAQRDIASKEIDYQVDSFINYIQENNIRSICLDGLKTNSKVIEKLFDSGYIQVIEGLSLRNCFDYEYSVADFLHDLSNVSNNLVFMDISCNSAPSINDCLKFDFFHNGQYPSIIIADNCYNSLPLLFQLIIDSSVSNIRGNRYIKKLVFTNCHDFDCSPKSINMLTDYVDMYEDRIKVSSRIEYLDISANDMLWLWLSNKIAVKKYFIDSLCRMLYRVGQDISVFICRNNKMGDSSYHGISIDLFSYMFKRLTNLKVALLSNNHINNYYCSKILRYMNDNCAACCDLSDNAIDYSYAMRKLNDYDYLTMLLDFYNYKYNHVERDSIIKLQNKRNCVFYENGFHFVRYTS